jgi:hypothetical protein
MKKKSSRNESGLSAHKRHKKELKPPFLQIGKLSYSSWIHDRLPDMLWAVLVIENLEREKALHFFRSIGEFVFNNKELYDVTISGIGKLSSDDAKLIINHMISWSEEIPIILRPLRLYPEIPASDVWNELLDEAIPEEDWDKLSCAVMKSFSHQSQEATDCRWVKTLCLISGGKLHFPSDKRDLATEIVQYPQNDDPKRVESEIRAIEIAIVNEENSWSKNFWEENYRSTPCFPEERIIEKIEARKKEFVEELKNSRKHFVEETTRVRNNLITHYFKSLNTTNVDPRHETSFGLALYGLTLFTEIILYSVSNSITGRIALRSLIEIYITLKYLLIKEREVNQIWDDFHTYGTGQIKLIYLKLQELTMQSDSIEMDDLYLILNEDVFLEFTPINLGQWGNSDLRKMSDYAGIKEIYDLYYNYTSGFVHGTRGSIRESVYQRCINPLHRYHRIPEYNLPLMPSVTSDSIIVVNELLECLNSVYPTFDDKIKIPQNNESVNSEGD